MRVFHSFLCLFSTHTCRSTRSNYLLLRYTMAKLFVAGLSVDWRDPVKWQLVVDTSGRGPVSSQVDPIDGRPGRSRLGVGRSLRLIRPTTSPSLSQVIWNIEIAFH